MRTAFLAVFSLALVPALGDAQPPPAERVAPGAGAAANWGPPVSQADLSAALEAARPEMEACLEGGPRSSTVRVLLGGDAELRFTVRTRPRDRRVERCIDTAARRHVTPLISRPLRRPVRASVRLRRPAPAAPPSAEPAPL